MAITGKAIKNFLRSIPHATGGFIRGVVTMPLMFMKQLDRDPAQITNSRPSKKWLARIREKVRGGFLFKLGQATWKTLMHPFVMAENAIVAAMPQFKDLPSPATASTASPHSAASPFPTSTTQANGDIYNFLLKDPKRSEMKKKPVPPSSIGLYGYLRFAFAFLTGFLYGIIRSPAAIASDMIRQFQEKELFTWLLELVPELITSFATSLIKTPKDWLNDEKNLLWAEHYKSYFSQANHKRTSIAEDIGAFFRGVVGFIAGCIGAAGYALYFAFVKSPEYEEKFFQTIFKAVPRLLQALVTFPFIAANKLAHPQENPMVRVRETYGYSTTATATASPAPERSDYSDTNSDNPLPKLNLGAARQRSGQKPDISISTTFRPNK